LARRERPRRAVDMPRRARKTLGLWQRPDSVWRLGPSGARVTLARARRVMVATKAAAMAAKEAAARRRSRVERGRPWASIYASGRRGEAGDEGG
jgi:hypothetical protein